MEALTLRGEEHTHDTLLLASATRKNVDFEVFDGVKGKNEIILSAKQWRRLVKHIEQQLEQEEHPG